MVLTKRNPTDLDLLHQILVCRGLRPFLGASDWWQIDFLVSQVSRADLRALDNIVLTRTRDSLVQNIIFFIFFENP